MSAFVYADNAATTRLDESALEAMLPWLREEYGNPSQPYFFAQKARKTIKEARETIAACINAEPDEIYFTSGGTESDNWVIKNCGSDTDTKTIVTSSIEHHAILNPCKRMADSSEASIEYLSVDRYGMVSGEELIRALSSLRKGSDDSDKTILVSVMLANNEIGTIEPIKELAGIAHSYNAWFHTDAVQAVGHVPIDVKNLGVDFLSASAHKFNGPKGVGFLYVRKGSFLSPHNDGGAQEHGLRAGTENVAGIVGMAAALKENCDHLAENAARITELEERLISGLGSLDYIRNGAVNHIPGNISLSFRDADGEAILHRMDLKKICISTGSACDSVNTQISHVIKAIGVPEEYAKGTIRISLGKNNTVADVDKILCELKSIVS